MRPLPIDDVLPEILDALAASPALVLRAPTGAGKTTRVPPAVLDAGLAGGRRVVMLEPRRVAARAAARRMAEERGFTDAELAALLPVLCAGKRSFAELRRAPLVETLKGVLGYERLAALERHAPERLAVPSGSRIVLAYEPGRAPVLAARIQELFGLRETPRVAAGRVAVMMHLLAPNGRPQQITQDLESFWANTYPQVRKELQGRYPKHAWPQDPWTATAERRPRRRS